ncbi:MAG: Stp1/IreP family PP2C-type Ser/Thr phosphatase [Peptostreptococcales bacterium]
MLIGARSDIGSGRKINEDAYYISSSDDYVILADGVGGAKAGSVASQKAVEFIKTYIDNNPIDKGFNRQLIKEYFRKCIDEVNSFIIDLANSNGDYEGMGTTIVIGYWFGEKMYFINMGDSRGYLIRDNQIIQITADHTYPAELFNTGEISKDEMLNHPQKHVITRALGIIKDMSADFHDIQIEEDDYILLCTDGVYENISNQEILDVFSKGFDVQEICDYIVDLANERNTQDNITILTLKNGGAR